MSTGKGLSDFFKRMIQKREENTTALEERTKGSFKVKRFQPLAEKKAPRQPDQDSDNPPGSL